MGGYVHGRGTRKAEALVLGLPTLPAGGPRPTHGLNQQEAGRRGLEGALEDGGTWKMGLILSSAPGGPEGW